MAQFTNQAQLSYNNAVKNSNIAVGEILEVLSATKTAVENAYGQNDTVTYVINIVNSGTLAFTGLNISDNLGSVHGKYPYADASGICAGNPAVLRGWSPADSACGDSGTAPCDIRNYRTGRRERHADL